MIERHRFLYLFLCIVPFFNIISLHTNITVVLTLILFFFSFNLVLFKTKPVSVVFINYILIACCLSIILIISQIYSLIEISSSNFTAIRFFGLFLPISIFFILIYDPSTIVNNFLERILKLYIIILSLSIFIDFYILHSSLDISLQPMYSEDARSYMARPFGLFGQPSVNSVLLVFFYTFWLSLENKNVKSSSYLFLLVTLGVLLQGSGSGFISYLMLFTAYKYVNIFIKLIIFALAACGILFIINTFEILDKLSYEYIYGIVSVFIYQIGDWLDLIDQSFYGSFFLGGISSKIDFGPLFMISNVGFIYFITLLILFIYLISICKNHYERMCIYILLVGNLHYPVIFYMIMAFVLPLFIIKVISNLNPKKEIYHSIANKL